MFFRDMDAGDSWPLQLVNAPLRAAEMFNFCPFHRCFLLVLTECLCFCHDDFPLSFAPPFHLCRQYRGDSIVAIPFTAPLRLEVADCNLGVPFGFFLVSQSLSFCSTNLSVGRLSYSPNTSLTKNIKKKQYNSYCRINIFFLPLQGESFP